MTALLSWDPGIRIGVDEIDLEHQTFVVLINELDKYKDNPEIAPRTLQSLLKYAAFHFQSEENILYIAGYPELEAHHASHLALLNKLNTINIRLYNGEIDYQSVVAFFQLWYVNHTSIEDMRFALFLHGTQQNPPAPPNSE